MGLPLAALALPVRYINHVRGPALAAVRGWPTQGPERGTLLTTLAPLIHHINHVRCLALAAV